MKMKRTNHRHEGPSEDRVSNIVIEGFGGDNWKWHVRDEQRKEGGGAV